MKSLNIFEELSVQNTSILNKVDIATPCSLATNKAQNITTTTPYWQISFDRRNNKVDLETAEQIFD